MSTFKRKQSPFQGWLGMVWNSIQDGLENSCLAQSSKSTVNHSQIVENSAKIPINLDLSGLFLEDKDILKMTDMIEQEIRNFSEEYKLSSDPILTIDCLDLGVKQHCVWMNNIDDPTALKGLFSNKNQLTDSGADILLNFIAMNKGTILLKKLILDGNDGIAVGKKKQLENLVQSIVESSNLKSELKKMKK